MYSRGKLQVISNGEFLPQSLLNVQGASKTIKGYSFDCDPIAIDDAFNILKTKFDVPDEKLKAWYKYEKKLEKELQKIQEETYVPIERDCYNKGLKDYQKKSIDFFIKAKQCIIGHDRGLGKTLIALSCIKAIKAKKTLVIVQSYIKYSFGEEIEKWTNLSYSIIDGTPKEREQGYRDFFDNNRDILILNYEQVRVNKVKDKETGKIKETIIKIDNSIKDFKWDLIVCDEAHRLKSRDSQVSEGVNYLKSKHHLFMTGTPITKSETEIWRLLNIFDSRRFKSFWNFAKYYCSVDRNMYGIVIGMLRKPDEYKRLINRYMFRLLKEDVAKHLPEKIVKIIPVKMGKIQKSAYDLAKEEYLMPNPDADIIESDVERFIRLCQVCQNPAILDGKNVSCVTDGCLDLLEDISERVIVASTYIRMSELLTQEIEKKFKNRNVYLINGTVKIKNRQDILNKFKKDETGILVVTIKALAEGVNLDCCDTIINLDYDWNCGTNDQFSDRIHRMTSKVTKYYYHFVIKNTVHELKYEKIINEATRMSSALGDVKRNIKYIMEELKNEIK
jgi:SNF2 family DNA or RNA helicase